ncbi:hypothetical protein GCM10010269_10700 [Streptomyces humidus]|uniref:Uncharacterized protein n=1 Tax=Streptomyces humidus TaxID=52259 RepID=A0A918FS33_9ACTN|nr:hypothetical protein GCM10010269_10700 [Streptomyces humidus]
MRDPEGTGAGPKAGAARPLTGAGGTAPSERGAGTAEERDTADGRGAEGEEGPGAPLGDGGTACPATARWTE